MHTAVLNKWGHSYGVRIPQVVLKQLGFERGGALEFHVDVQAQRLILQSAVKRQGWQEAFNQGHIDDKEPIMNFSNAFDEDEWTW